MSDPTRPPEDPFADLYGRLPDSRSRGDAATPSSRRAAREAAERAARSDAPTPAVPAQPGPRRTGSPASPRVAAAGGAGAPPRGQSDLDALFAAAPKGTARELRKQRKRGPGPWIALAVVVVLLGGVAAGGLWVWNAYQPQIRAFMGWEEPKDYEDGIAEGEATITIQSGDGGQQISQTLFDAGVTKTPQAFYDMLIGLSPQPIFYPGVYRLQQKMSASAALAALQDPASKLDYTTQLREGLTVKDSIERISEDLGIPLADLQTAVDDPSAFGVAADSLEGWLFPATYTFDPGVSAHDVIQTLVNRAVQSLDAAGVPADQREQILTIASIVQREARSEGDFYKVSRVIQNRLADGMKLQMDSTAQYGYGELHDGTASSSQEALDSDNAWNTYIVTGLPAGPIANPGDVAIDAAMHPADGPWLYFVTVNLDTGETVFSETYDEQQAAEARMHEWCAANPSSGC